MVQKIRLMVKMATLVMGYTTYFSSTVFFALMILPVSLLLLPFGKSQQVFQSGMRWTLRFLVRNYLPLFRIAHIERYSNDSLLKEVSPAIIIGNHRSWLDGPMILSHGENIMPLMKEGYARNPLYSTFTRWFNFISINSASPDSILQAKQHSKTILESGGKLLIFPEGSRSSTKRMLPFRRFAFQLAVETGVPIIPVLQKTSTPFMTKGSKDSFFPKQEVVITVDVLDPILPQSGESADAFTARVEQLMIRKLKEFDQESLS